MMGNGFGLIGFGGQSAKEQLFPIDICCIGKADERPYMRPKFRSSWGLKVL